MISPSMEFKDDPDSMFVEHVLASVSEHHSGKNRDQTISRMRGRMLNGHWPFNPPVGYTWTKLPEHGKTYVRDEPIASILQEALEGFASGRFETQAEVKRFLEAQPMFPKNKKTGTLTSQRIKDMLTQRLYAGYLEYPKWNVSLRKAQFEPIISFETFQAIQDRLNGRPKAAVRKDISADFPLRGFVLCDDCEKPLTACWSKGRSKRYPYYYCMTKGCESRSKSIRKETIEGEFDELLADASPTQSLFDLAAAMFRDLWDQRLQRGAEQKQAMQRELSKVETQVENIVDRIVNTDNARVIETYEKRLGTPGCGQDRAEGKNRQNRQTGEGLRRVVSNRFGISRKPAETLAFRAFEEQRAVLRLTFANNLRYAPKRVFEPPIYPYLSSSYGIFQTEIKEWRAQKDSNLRPPA